MAEYDISKLVDELTDAKANNKELTRDLEQAKRTVENQMRQLASSNPAMVTRLNEARSSAQILLEKIYPQVDPSSNIHKEIGDWMERFAMRGNDASVVTNPHTIR